MLNRDRAWSAILALLLLPACGEQESGPPDNGLGPTYAACEERVSVGSVTQVDLRVSSPIPVELSTGCSAGAVSELEAMVLDVSATGACMLEVGATIASGCCPNVPADQNPRVTLYYRLKANILPIAEQSKVIYLPSTSAPVVDLSFAGIAPDEASYDIDSDGVGNLTEWCAGTL